MEQTQLWSSSGKELTKYLKGGISPSYEALPSKCKVPHATSIIYTKDIPFELVSCLLNLFLPGKLCDWSSDTTCL